MNQINLTGYATVKPREYKSGNGTPYYSFTLAVNRIKGDADFFFCVAYENLVKVLKYVDKGKFLRITGRMHCNNKEWSLVCNEIELMPKSTNKEDLECVPV